MSNKIYSFIGLIQKSGKLSSGDDTVEIDIKKGRSRLLLIAGDASDNTKNKFENSAKFYKIPFMYYGTKGELGSAIGKSERSVASINDKGFADAFASKVVEENGGVSIV